MTIGELVIELGFKADQIKFNEFIKSVGELRMSSVMGALGLAGLYETIQKIMTVSEESALSMNLFTKETGLSSEKMKAWSNFAEQMGIKGETMASALTTLQSKLTGLKGGWDQSLLTPFLFLNKAGAGITGREDPFALIEKVRKGLKGLSPEMQKQVVEWLGLNTEILAVLKQEDSVWKDINSQLTPSTEQVGKMLEYHKQLSKLTQDWKLLLMDIGAFLAPIITQLDHAVTTILELVESKKSLGEKIDISKKYVLEVSPLANIGKLFAYGIMDLQNKLLSDTRSVPAVVGTGSTTKVHQSTYNIRLISSDPAQSGKQVVEEIKKFNEEYERASQQASQGGK